jgi:membrane protein involved in colicin uptake
MQKAEREAKEKLEAELKAKAEAEQKARKEAEEKAAAELKAKQDAEKKAKAAPDKAKLNDFAKMLDELTLPELKSEEANKVLSDAKTLLQKVSTFIREKSSII